MCLAAFLPLSSPAEDGSAFQWVNIGSNSGLFAFDWESAGVRGLNLAGSPQSERRGGGKGQGGGDEPWETTKAKLFAFGCDRTAIGVSPHDARGSSK